MPKLEAVKKEDPQRIDSPKRETSFEIAEKIENAANADLAKVIELKPNLKKIPLESDRQLADIDSQAVLARDDLDIEMDKNLRLVSPEKQEKKDLDLDIKAAFFYAGFDLDPMQLKQIAAKIQNKEKISSDYLYSLFPDINNEQKVKLRDGFKFLYPGLLKMNFLETLKYYTSSERGRGFGGMELTMAYQKAQLLFQELNGSKAENALYPGSGDDWSGTIPSLAPLKKITGLDLTRGYDNKLPEIHSNFEFVDADITKLQNKKIEGLESDSYDLLAIGNYDCPVWDKNAMEEFKRLLKPDGLIIIKNFQGAKSSLGFKTTEAYKQLGRVISLSKNNNQLIIQIKKELPKEVPVKG